MAIVIDATPIGTATNNSYVTLAEANAYFELRANSTAWNDIVDDEEKKRLIVSSTKRIDYEKYDGELVSTIQSLSFPRTGLPLLDGRDVDNIIPKNIKEATYELAIYLKGVDISKPDLTTAPIEQVKVGNIDVKYKIDKNDNATKSSQELPPNVLYLLDDLSYTAGSGVMTVYR